MSAHSRSRFARLRVRYPAQPTPSPAIRRHLVADMPQPGTPYDISLAMELLANTCELPSSRRDLRVLLTHYRRALHALVGHYPGTS